MAYPPAALATRTNSSDANTGGSGAHAADHTALMDAVDDIVTELGPDPKGSDATVQERLERIDTTVLGVQSATAWTPGDQGFKAWSMDPGLWSLNSTSLTLGTLYLVSLYVPAGTVTGICFRSATGGTLTTFLASIFDAAAARLGLTADIDTAVMATGNIEADLTAPLVFTERTLIRVGLQSAGSVACALGRSGSSDSSNARRTTANARYATANTGLTTTVPSTHATMVLANATIGVGVY